MKVTFPHLGKTYITAKVLLDELNIDYIIPPFNNRRALEMGTRYVPESACLPLKITVGNLMEAYRMGADTVLMTGGCGPCRFGYYCEMQREILEDVSCPMDVIALEPPYGDVMELLRRIKRVAGNFNIIKILNAVRAATRISVRVDELERLCFRVRPREINKGETSNIYRAFRQEVLKHKGARDIEKLIDKAFNNISRIKTIDDKKPLKIGIVGEIYTTIDSHTNMEIEERLGHMGIEVHRSVTVSGWIVEHMIKKALNLPRDMAFAKAAEPYLGKMIGGHAQETIGNTVIYSNKGYDGIIQIYPLGCMPEIVSQSILARVSRDRELPVLTLIIDEMTGEAGYMTRVEAFIDLLYKRRGTCKAR